VPVDGFWSVSVYDAKGYYEPNKYGAYSLNNGTAKKDADGSIKIQFGGCDAKTVNCLPITPGWNYMVRLYRPRPEGVERKLAFPRSAACFVKGRKPASARRFLSLSYAPVTAEATR